MKNPMVCMALLLAGCGVFEESQPEKVAKTEVFVAQNQVNQWTTIVDPGTLFERKTRSIQNVPADAIKRLDDLKGRILIRTLRTGDIVCTSHLFADTSGNADHLAPGRIAMAVSVEREAVGNIQPGNRVDVFIAAAKEPILSRVLIRAVDGAGNGKMHVTLELSRDDALRLSACQSGELRLVLIKGAPEPRNDQAPPPPPSPPPLPN